MQRPHDCYCLELGRPFVADLQLLAYTYWPSAWGVERASTNVSTFSIYLATCEAFKADDTSIQCAQDVNSKHTAACAPKSENNVTTT